MKTFMEDAKIAQRSRGLLRQPQLAAAFQLHFEPRQHLLLT